MKYNRLGHSELLVSELCLGTMTFGQQNTPQEAEEQLDLALDRGINFIDTAEMYSVPPRAETQGRSEAYVALAEELGISPAKLALSFVRSRWFVSSTILGATTRAQLEENLASLDVSLDASALARIDAIHLRYPNPAP